MYYGEELLHYGEEFGIGAQPLYYREQVLYDKNDKFCAMEGEFVFGIFIYFDLIRVATFFSSIACQPASSHPAGQPAT